MATLDGGSSTMESFSGATPGIFFTDEDWDGSVDSTISDAELGNRQYPMSAKDADFIDKLLADEVERLSLEEKERAIFDVHGMSLEGKDPDDLETLLQQLELEIDIIPDKEAYDEAKRINEEYVTDRAFRVMFLRCKEFDVKLAAKQIVDHFEVKKELFGGGAILGRDIQISDLSKDGDMDALETGLWQILPVRDAAGRLVLFHSPASAGKELSDDNMVRVVFYVHMIASRLEDVQRRGLILVSWWDHNSFHPIQVYNFMRKKMTLMQRSIPRKISCAHFLISQAYLRPVVTGVRWFIRDAARARTRCHFGGLEQMKFELQTFGIPTDCLPIFKSGDTPNLENHKQWIVSQRKREEGDGQQADILVPGRFDVLFGRARSTRSHPGNLRAIHMVEMFRDKYEAVGKFEKTAIAERIVVMIQKSNGRFLKWEDDVWLEVDQQTARNKISHLFRNARSKARAATHNATPSSSDDPKPNGEARTTKRTHSEPETQAAQRQCQRVS